MINSNNSNGGQSKYQTNMALLSELHSLCRNMTFYLERRALPESADEFDPQVIRFNFRIAKNGRQRFLTILDELRNNGVSLGIAAREIDCDDLQTTWLQQLTGKSAESSNPVWRKEFYNHLRKATTNCQARLEFTPPTREDEAGQINLVVILNPGLLEKFVYAIESLGVLGVTGSMQLVEQSV